MRLQEHISALDRLREASVEFPRKRRFAQVYVARSLLKNTKGLPQEKFLLRPACSSFGQHEEVSDGEFNWLFGDGKIGIVLSGDEHTSDAFNFYLALEHIADGYEGGHIFVNPRDDCPSISIFPRGKIDFQRNPNAERLAEFLINSPVNLYKAWKDAEPDSPLDYLVFSRATPNSLVYRMAGNASITFD